jgi:hypothetical protein
MTRLDHNKELPRYKNYCLAVALVQRQLLGKRRNAGRVGSGSCELSGGATLGPGQGELAAGSPHLGVIASLRQSNFESRGRCPPPP